MHMNVKYKNYLLQRGDEKLHSIQYTKKNLVRYSVHIIGEVMKYFKALYSPNSSLNMDSQRCYPSSSN